MKSPDSRHSTHSHSPVSLVWRVSAYWATSPTRWPPLWEPSTGSCTPASTPQWSVPISAAHGPEPSSEQFPRLWATRQQRVTWIRLPGVSPLFYFHGNSRILMDWAGIWEAIIVRWVGRPEKPVRLISALKSLIFQAGYRVMCVTNERLCRVTSIRHSVALLGLCSIAAPLTDLTTVTFAIGKCFGWNWAQKFHSRLSACQRVPRLPVLQVLQGSGCEEQSETVLLLTFAPSTYHVAHGNQQLWTEWRAEGTRYG